MLEALAAIMLGVFGFYGLASYLRNRVNYAILRTVQALNEPPAVHWNDIPGSNSPNAHQFEASERETLPIPLIVDTSRLRLHSNPPINTKHGGYC